MILDTNLNYDIENVVSKKNFQLIEELNKIQTSEIINDLLSAEQLLTENKMFISAKW